LKGHLFDAKPNAAVNFKYLVPYYQNHLRREKIMQTGLGPLCSMAHLRCGILNFNKEIPLKSQIQRGISFIVSCRYRIPSFMPCGIVIYEYTHCMNEIV
jgi:hypothetical protein